MKAPARSLPVLITLATVLAAATAHPSLAAEVRIQYAEPLATLTIERAKDDPTAARARAVRMRFHALQRDFDATLEDNARLLDGLSSAHRARLEGLELCRGTLAGIPGSWVRLSVRDGVARALIWDGIELYGLAPASSVSALMDEPMPRSAYAVFRIGDLGRDFLDRVLTGTASGRSSNEVAAQSAGPRKRVDIGVVTDFEAQRYFSGVRADEDVAERMNMVDGIFSEQVGIQMRVAEIESFATEPDPFSSSDPDTLLGNLSDLRVQTPALAQQGIVHLLTGRDLQDQIIGEAYMASVCDPELAVGLSQMSSESIVDALVIAHEIGHNFGAPHDNETGSPCVSTPPVFLMAPEFNNSSQFSQCSLDQMRPVINAASCLKAVLPGDLAVNMDAPDVLDAGATTGTIGLQVVNSSEVGAYDVSLDFSAGPLIEILSYEVPSPFDCTNSDAQHISCHAAALPANTSAGMRVPILATTPGVVTLTLEASASNDTNSANNRVTQQLQIAAVPVFNVTFTPARLALHPDESGTLHVTVRNVGTGAGDARIAFQQGGFILENIVPRVGTCQVSSRLCRVPSIRPGAEASFGVTLRALPSVDPDAGLESHLSINVTSDEFPSARADLDVPLVSYATLAELSARLVSVPAEVHPGDVVPVVIAVDNAGPDAVGELTVSIANTIGGTNTDLHTDSGSCTFDEAFGDCTLLDVAPGSTVQVELDVRVAESGDTVLQRGFQIAYSGVSDSNRGDDSDIWIASVTAAPAQPPSQGSSGGGGGASITLLLVAGLRIGARRMTTFLTYRGASPHHRST